MRCKKLILGAVATLFVSSAAFAVMHNGAANDNDKGKLKVIVINNPTEQEFELVRLEKAPPAAAQQQPQQQPAAPRMMGRPGAPGAAERECAVVFDLGDFKNCRLTIAKKNDQGARMGTDTRTETATCDEGKQIENVNIKVEKKDEPMAYKLVTVTFDKDAAATNNNAAE